MINILIYLVLSLTTCRFLLRQRITAVKEHCKTNPTKLLRCRAWLVSLGISLPVFVTLGQPMLLLTGKTSTRRPCSFTLNVASKVLRRILVWYVEVDWGYLRFGTRRILVLEEGPDRFANCSIHAYLPKPCCLLPRRRSRLTMSKRARFEESGLDGMDNGFEMPRASGVEGGPIPQNPLPKPSLTSFPGPKSGHKLSAMLLN